MTRHTRLLAPSCLGHIPLRPCVPYSRSTGARHVLIPSGAIQRLQRTVGDLLPSTWRDRAGAWGSVTEA
ncbi:hypothetical protein CRG98_043907 [Punica granatum]|uniref:Uncharacterized protein n=1 Tax=Punica granatum TaxID=22663 RepID=A0A2I0HVL7_PUNGR|nr:hypothetical protein CRG98_043907 [Punica granatum]